MDLTCKTRTSLLSNPIYPNGCCSPSVENLESCQVLKHPHSPPPHLSGVHVFLGLYGY